MAATFKSIVVEQGAKFELNVQARTSSGAILPLIGYEARMQIRPTVESSTVLLAASTADGRITINGPGGIVMISIGADVTTALTWTSGGVWDLEAFTSASNVIRLAKGFAYLDLEVTR
jgi:hypothetical protein